MQFFGSLNRWIFIIVSALIISLILWSTFGFFKQLKENEREKMLIWAEAQKEIASFDVDLETPLSATSLTAISSNKTTPMILYSHKDNKYDSNNLDPAVVNNPIKRAKLISQFNSEYKPLDIKFNGKLIQTVYYGNSPLINKLKYYPAILIIMLMLFIAAIYYFNKTAKSAEQNKLWAGMAKETAHQIGTPLSSLVGWTEILKTENVDQSYVVEMEKDITRLEMITERFSKVGSVPTLERKNLVTETIEAYDYLKNRSSKLINFDLKIPSEPIFVDLNTQLFSWTVENLVKNGIDAMRGKGDISVVVEATDRHALIYVTDTGKGIPKKYHKRIFTPGFTTKKRGWGLGLSLAKRIIEEYHNGKIKVLKSSPGKGTTFVISLKLASA
ncbi:sensor histidine kinase [Patiriisocius marinus]|uniref:sensor histidine kinase n=1 Tax=Patiriisocius marinus TaxID=1397112 RepID=UPI00124EDB30|nr:HAMP domain-containing sensor histidine kinase [Patiriisocius marinus]